MRIRIVRTEMEIESCLPAHSACVKVALHAFKCNWRLSFCHRSIAIDLLAVIVLPVAPPVLSNEETESAPK